MTVFDPRYTHQDTHAEPRHCGDTHQDVRGRWFPTRPPGMPPFRAPSMTVNEPMMPPPTATAPLPHAMTVNEPMMPPPTATVPLPHGTVPHTATRPPTATVPHRSTPYSRLPEVIILHGRTCRELGNVEWHWSESGQAFQCCGCGGVRSGGVRLLPWGVARCRQVELGTFIATSFSFGDLMPAHD